MVSLRNIGFIVCCLSLLGACSSRNSAEAILADYLHRVETATGIVSEEPASLLLMAYPSRRDRALPVDEIRIGFMDYLKFYECDLFRLVSERNSVLGKVMPLSKRLAYEINFLQAAESCRRKLTKDKAINGQFVEQFTEIIQLKRKNIYPLFWNAIFDSSEMQQALSLAVDPLDIDEQTTYTDSRQAIDYFQRLGIRLNHSGSDISLENLEDQYFTLQRHRYGGRLFQSFAQLTEYLNRVAYSLEISIQDTPPCQGNQLNQKIRQLRGVFTEHYVVNVKPYVTRIYHHGRDWLQALDRLIQLQKVSVPASFREYQVRMLSLDSEQSLWRAFDQAFQRHTKAWQVLLSQCGVTTGPRS